jgi:hypothetical protein
MGIMVDGAVKDGRIQSPGAPLSAFWTASTHQAAAILAGLGPAAARLNPGRAVSRRAPGRHAAPARVRYPRIRLPPFAAAAGG